MATSPAQYARAAPLNAIAAYGLAGRGRRRRAPGTALNDLRAGPDGAYWALETAGRTGLRLLLVIAAHGGRISDEQLRFETRAADADLIAAEIQRLADAELIRPTTGRDGFEMPDALVRLFPDGPWSMADPQMLTTAKLDSICRKLRARPPQRKQERIDLIAAIFADPERASVVREEMSPEAQELLGRIADSAGTGRTTATELGINSYDIRRSLYPSYTYRRSGSDRAEGPNAAATRELMELGIIGLSDWEDHVWIWREAWPLLQRPYFTSWPIVPAPGLAAAEPLPPRVPAIVAALDRALALWQSDPPAVLKSGQARLSRPAVKTLGKSLQVSVTDVDVMARQAMGIGLLVPETVAVTGRGRNRRAEQVWRPDPELTAAWSELQPIDRWLRLVDDWSRPLISIDDGVIATRHLLLWELANLPEDQGWADRQELIAWLSDKYSASVTPEATEDSLLALRSLGVINPEGPIRLSTLGAAALAGPEAVAQIDLGQSTQAIVQADHTVIAPPDLRADIAARLSTIAKVESDAGAFIYRLDAELITRAVQSGQSGEDIVDFLTELSQVPIGRAVTEFVRDAAAQADRVSLMPAATVVVVKRPADLKLVCAVRPARLAPVSDTVAVSDLPPAKVRIALERKGLSPGLLTGGPGSEGTAGGKAGGTRKGPRAGSPSGAAGTASPETGPESDDKVAAATPAAMAQLRVTAPIGLTPDLVSALDKPKGRRAKRS